MRALHLAVTLLLAGFAWTRPNPASAAEQFPARPVRVIVQTGPGASIDLTARILADSLAGRWKQSVNVVNLPGAGGIIAAKALAEAKPDGETLFFGGSSVLVALPELYGERSPRVDAFVQVAFVAEQPMAIVVAANSRIESLTQLLEEIRGKSGGYNCAVGTRGGLAHLTAEYFKQESKSDLTMVFYPGTARALTDVIAGEVPILIDSLAAFMGPAASGQVRILAVASANRLSGLPQVPTIAETVPGFEATAWFGLFAAPGTPQPVAADVEASLEERGFRDRLAELGTFVRRMPLGELGTFIEAQRRQWLPIVRKVGKSD